MKTVNEYQNNETLSGVIDNIVYKNDNNDYTVMEIMSENGAVVTAVGTIPMAIEGENVILIGNWSYHSEFGKQFCFDRYEKTLPQEAEGIIQYLSSGAVKGVGPATALKIVNKFGTDAFDVIENHPEWLADVPGITLKKAAAIAESFAEQNGVRDAVIFCKNYISIAEITRVYKKLGKETLGMIKENPYILCDGGYGISFDKVDAFAKSLNVLPQSPMRILSATKYVLSYNAVMNGHTCLPLGKLASAVSVLIEISEDSVLEFINGTSAKSELEICNTDTDTYVMTTDVFQSEKYIAEKIRELENGINAFSVSDVSVILEKLESRFGLNYAELQKKAIYEALNNGVMILTGGPGTGKTTVIKALLSIFDSLGMKCALAAPTGRAAKRMSIATSAEAKTVHRMLEMEHSSENKVVCRRNTRNPLEENAIIIDEASMMDLTLTVALFKAVKKGTRLILIGDSDQLPSVGAGNVFADFISSGKIKTVKLTEIFRQSEESLIITNAHRINSGLSPVLNVTDKDFFFVRRENELEIPSTIADLITKRLPKTYGDAIREQIQVITPSKKGNGGVEALNAELQKKINPPGKFKREKESHGVIFREGDKVMQTVNNYDIEWEKDGYVGTGIFNGDIGVIESIDNSKSEMNIRFDDKRVIYDFEFLKDLDLAYAITVHKSQGSEYPVVIIPMYRCPPVLMTRNLLYTAVTRAKQMVILVGRADIPAQMAKNNREILRYTMLCRYICNN